MNTQTDITESNYLATCAKGFEYLLVDELIALGGKDVAEQLGAVRFSGDLEMAYRACLWSRLASRILLPIANFKAADDAALYQGVGDIRWDKHMLSDATMAVDVHCYQSKISHSQFAAQRVKDAVVDQFRRVTGQRPTVERLQPDVRLHVSLKNDIANLSIDLSGKSLHQRGYRLAAGEAPLKENLAAAMLYRSGWVKNHASLKYLIDPLCGSGTIVIEAAMIACDIAPGILRDYFGFYGWQQHQASIWEKLLSEAKERKEQGLKQTDIEFHGYDRDRDLLEIASENSRVAGLSSVINFSAQNLNQLKNTQSTSGGLLITNPPYGERLGDKERLKKLYRELGSLLRKHFLAWNVSLLCSDDELSRQIGLRAVKKYRLNNGPIDCQLLNFEVSAERMMRGFSDDNFAPKEGLSDSASMLKNRLLKNKKRLSKELKRGEISCYRLYDADLPEYAAAIDVYADRVHIQEYKAPADIPQRKTERRLKDIRLVIEDIFKLKKDRIFLKQRLRQRGKKQYDKHASTGEEFQVEENGFKFLVNLSDYLDTGLFLDHRNARQMILEKANKIDFLNLFCYTASATVYAAAGNARSTTSVDLSNNYIAWASRNMALNGFSGSQHCVVKADVFKWLEACRNKYQLIFLDPPTFSTSKSMDKNFDIERDQVALISRCMELLSPEGLLLFSTNFRKFALSPQIASTYNVVEITNKTLPFDYQQKANSHRCFEIRLIR